MLSTADEDGVVGASVGGLAHLSRVTRDECAAALETFLNPDPDSRSENDDGRRIEKVEGGWRVINIQKYRDMRTKKQVREAEKKARWRESVDTVDSPPASTLSTVEEEEDSDLDSSSPSSPPPSGNIVERNQAAFDAFDILPAEFLDDYSELLRRVTAAGGSGQAWGAEIRVSVDGMHGQPRSPEEIGQTIRDFNAAGADLSLRLFRGYLRGNGSQSPDRGSGERSGGKNTGLMAASDLLKRVQKEKDWSTGRAGAKKDWRDRFSEPELRVIDAIGFDRIMADDPKTRGILQAQTAKMLTELSQ